MPPASASAATSAPLPQPAGPTPGQAAVAGGVRGMFTGLVLGIIWGCYEEKKFVLRNCIKEYHLRESPIRLFSVMRRSVTTAPAGAVRSVLAEAALTMHPWIHAQRSLAAGLAAAGLFALGGALEEEQRRQRGQAEQWSEALELTGDD
ncbi:hypothetical protein ABPG75_010756 [Micractinium tetrahymenae]